jgi:hypothetical protein
MGNRVGENSNVVVSELLFVALIVFPNERQLAAESPVAETIAAHPADIDRATRLVA